VWPNNLMFVMAVMVLAGHELNTGMRCTDTLLNLASSSFTLGIKFFRVTPQQALAGGWQLQQWNRPVQLQYPVQYYFFIAQCDCRSSGPGRSSGGSASRGLVLLTHQPTQTSMPCITTIRVAAGKQRADLYSTYGTAPCPRSCSFH
jgi:hypothetical protein